MPTSYVDKFLKISEYFADQLGCKVRKIPVNAGLGCPGRCTYCNNAAFNPGYAHYRPGSITEQLSKGIAFTSRKGHTDGYLAYFQAYTNTFGDTEALIALYEEALAYPGVLGLVIATRPDCISDELADWFGSRFIGKGKPFLLIELGVESTKNKTLTAINRGHDWECSRNAILKLTGKGIAVGVHLIIGLPGENEEDFKDHIRKVSELPIVSLKLHQLQIIKGSPMAEAFSENPEHFELMPAERYARVVAGLLPLIRPDIAIDRFVSEAPKQMVLAPCWGLKPSEFGALLDKYLRP